MKIQIADDNRPSSLIHALLEIWEASVSATHLFLTKEDIQSIKPTVKKALEEIPLLIYMVTEPGRTPFGFMGVDNNKIEMLFISPEHTGRGFGGRFIDYAVNVLGATHVDVNEQNTRAVEFYKHAGFHVFKRSARDGRGNPFPLLHLKMELGEAVHRGYAVRRAEPGHIPLLNHIELSAATIFPPGSIPDSILSDKLPLDVLLTARDKGMLWVAVDTGDIPVGYALLRIVDGFALLAQMDVHPDHGRKGIGTALACRAIRQVRELGLTELYLTTFSHVKWNAPFYEKLGFQILETGKHPDFIKKILHEERKHGLDNRVAMRLRIRLRCFPLPGGHPDPRPTTG